jgi:hypothetical protein
VKPFVRGRWDTDQVGRITDEWSRLLTWQDRHRTLVARLSFLIALTFVIDVVATAGVYFLERKAAGTEVKTVFDAFFFTTVQLLTVSSQLKNPLTTGGRIVDMLLELWAVFVVAGSAGSMATFFLSDE